MMPIVTIPPSPPVLGVVFAPVTGLSIDFIYDLLTIPSLPFGYGTSNMANVATFKIQDGPVSLIATNDKHKVNPVPTQSPIWLEVISAASLGLAGIGLIAAFMHAGASAGLFPLGMAGAWLASRFARAY